MNFDEYLFRKKKRFKHIIYNLIMDIFQNADMDGDGDIDFAEWRKELKARGYSDLEIETVFAKYDQDGDKV